MEAKVAKTLLEAYASVYDQPEQIDELKYMPERPYDGPKVKSDPPKKKPRPPHSGPSKGGPYPGKPRIGLPIDRIKNMMNREDVDVFDIVKGHLIDEHNLSEDVALQLMSILDEETRGEIMEYTAAIRADAAPKGTTVKMTADGKEPIGDRLLRGIKDRVGGFLRNLNPNALKSKTVEPRKPLIAIPKN
jgi:hypothetical protein